MSTFDDFKIEHIVTRKFCKTSRNQPKDPLTVEEKERFKKELFSDFSKDYKRFIIQKGCLSDDERANLKSTKTVQGLMNRDLENDSYVLFHNCLEKFDKSNYHGKIAKSNTQGQGQPKTIDFFFMAQCRKMILWHIKENMRKPRKKEEIHSISQDMESDSGEFKDNSELDPETSLLLSMTSENGVSIMARFTGYLKARPFISYIFKKKFNFFTDEELAAEHRYENKSSQFEEFEKLLKKLSKTLFKGVF